MKKTKFYANLILQGLTTHNGKEALKRGDVVVSPGYLSDFWFFNNIQAFEGFREIKII
jgi:hypothetical protein